MPEETPTLLGMKAMRTPWFHAVLPSTINLGHFSDLIKTGESRLLLFLKFFWFEVSALNFLMHMCGILQPSLSPKKKEKRREERKLKSRLEGTAT